MVRTIPTRDVTVAALADPTRRSLLDRLMRGEAGVAELAAPFSISQFAISCHLRVLKAARLTDAVIKGTARTRRLNPDALQLPWD